MIEYDCWFQRGELKALGINTENLERVFTDEKGPILEQALREYRRGMEKCFGLETRPAGSDGSGAVRIGTIPHLNKNAAFRLSEQKADGFVIQASEQGIVIAGQDERGALYGV